MQAMIRCAAAEDFTRIVDFLKKADLGTEGITEEVMPYFLLMEDRLGGIKGILGIEALGNAGLLRSLAITPDLGEKDIMLLFEQMMLHAKNKHLQNIYLATNKKQALNLFYLLGFKETDKEHLPEEFTESKHIQHILGVDNSIFLQFPL